MIRPETQFKATIDNLCDKYSQRSNRSVFMQDLLSLMIACIQAGRQAGQGADGIVMCGRCNKVVHKCPQVGGEEKP